MLDFGVSPLLSRRKFVFSGSGLILGAGATAVYHLHNRPPTSTLNEAAQERGILLGTSLRANNEIWKPEHSRFLTENVSLYVPGTAFLPDYIEPTSGLYSLTDAQQFLDRVQLDGKLWRLHTLCFPSRDTQNVKESLSEQNWRSKMDSHFAAIASVSGSQSAHSVDVVNEIISAENPNTGGFDPNHWYNAAGGSSYIVHAFKKARELWPNSTLYWCQDSTEEASESSYHEANRALFLSALDEALANGAPIDGVNLQAHLRFSRDFVDAGLPAYLSAIRARGLKVMIGELDCRTGYRIGSTEDTPLPADYSPAQYDVLAAAHVGKFLRSALPYIDGGELVLWTLSDADNSWSRQPNPPGERPSPWDDAFQPKPMWQAVMDAIVEFQSAKSVTL